MTDTTTPTLDPWGDVLTGWDERPTAATGVRTFVPPGADYAAAMIVGDGSDPWNAKLKFLRGWGDFRSGGSYELDTAAALLHVPAPPRPERPRAPLHALPTPTRGRERSERPRSGGRRDDSAPDEVPAPLYVDVAEVLDGTHKGPVPTRGGRREDGAPLLYAAAVNILFGAPEAGKTLAAGGMAVHELEHDGRVLWIDIDHNGATALVTRLESLGAPRDQLADRARFRLAVPEDEHAVMDVLQDSVPWAPTLVIVDSIGELLPMFGAKTNDSDEYTGVHRRVLAATARITGAAVLAIDHEAKSNESRNYGSAGTMAKKRAVDGAMLRVVNVAPFTPGVGGESHLAIVKDRHGALRALTQAGKEPTVARFILTGKEDAMNIVFAAPVKPNLFEQQAKLTNLQELLRMDPPPRSVADVKRRLGWGSGKASDALREYRQFMRDPADELLDDDE